MPFNFVKLSCFLFLSATSVLSSPLHPRVNVQPYFLAAVLRQEVGSESGSGLTGEPCARQEDCLGTRQCISTGVAEPKQCSENEEMCFCLQLDQDKLVCSTSATCTSGERCVAQNGNSACLSCEAFKQSQSVEAALTAVDDGNCGASGASEEEMDTTFEEPAITPPQVDEEDFDDSLPQPSIMPVAVATPLPDQEKELESTATETPTETSEELFTGLSDGMSTASFPASNATATVPSTGPVQVTEPQEATTSSPEASEAPMSPEPSTSPQATPSPSPSISPLVAGTAVCIAAESLTHLPRSSLVFREHQDAAVLCDTAGSCATHGHVVVFGGRAMMMETYCSKHTACVERRMLVNSPRLMQRGLRVPSKTDGLTFTAFAARYRTRVEEHAIRALVHSGF